MMPPSQGSGPNLTGSVTTYCIPSFFVMIGGEMAMSWIYGDLTKVFRVNDSINSISFGIVQQSFASLVIPLIIKQYNLLYKYRLFDIPDSWSSAFTIMLLSDFLYYWGHRFGHEFNWMWAAHSIHHSSENFNFTTALRQAAFQGITMYWMGLYPAAIIGVPFNIFEFHRSLNVVMQFWIHTQYCKHLGLLEYIFNTPTQHIVHHSRAPAYCNTNYAGWFSIWDQLFGTFELQHRPKKFGVIEQHYTWDPVVINLKNYGLLFKRMMRKKGIIAKIKWLFSSSRYVSDGGINDKKLAKTIRYNPLLTTQQNIYSIVIFALSLFEYLVQMLNSKQKTFKAKLLGSMYLMFSLSSLAQYMNKSMLGRFTETFRWMIVIILLTSARFIGINKIPLVFDDSKYNIAQFLSSNIGYLTVKSNNKYKSFIGIGLIGFGFWSLKNILLTSTKVDEENDDMKLTSSK
eukprot:191037_1